MFKKTSTATPTILTKSNILSDMKKEVSDLEPEELIKQLDSQFLSKIRKAKKEQTKAFTKKELHEFIVEKVEAINETDDCKLSKK